MVRVPAACHTTWSLLPSAADLHGVYSAGLGDLLTPPLSVEHMLTPEALAPSAHPQQQDQQVCCMGRSCCPGPASQHPATPAGLQRALCWARPWMAHRAILQVKQAWLSCRQSAGRAPKASLWPWFVPAWLNALQCWAEGMLLQLVTWVARVLKGLHKAGTEILAS